MYYYVLNCKVRKLETGICSVCGKEVITRADRNEKGEYDYDMLTGLNWNEKTFCIECADEIEKKLKKESFDKLLKVVMKKVKKTYSCPLTDFTRCTFQSNSKEEMEKHVRGCHYHNTTELEWFAKDE